MHISRTDPDVNAPNDAVGETMGAAFAARIRDSVAAGAFCAELDADAAARMLLVLRSGLEIAARGGTGEAELRQAARLALRALVRG